jgi:hypothetical protein
MISLSKSICDHCIYFVPMCVLITFILSKNVLRKVKIQLRNNIHVYVYLSLLIMGNVKVNDIPVFVLNIVRYIHTLWMDIYESWYRSRFIPICNTLILAVIRGSDVEYADSCVALLHDDAIAGRQWDIVLCPRQLDIRVTGCHVTTEF